MAPCSRARTAPLPGLARVAKLQGIHPCRTVARHIQLGEALTPFRYGSRGNTAIAGRHAAIVEQGKLEVKGWTAWFGWDVIHVCVLVGFQHCLLLSMQWLWRYLPYDRGARQLPETTDPMAALSPRTRPATPDPVLATMKR